jgi:hypothetical protein
MNTNNNTNSFSNTNINIDYPQGDNPMPMDLGLAPYSRILLHFYIAYLAVVKHVKIPTLYFFFYIIVSILYIKRILFLKSNRLKYIEYHNRESIWQLPIFIETIFTLIINTSAFLYLTFKK